LRLRLAIFTALFLALTVVAPTSAQAASEDEPLRLGALVHGADAESDKTYTRAEAKRLAKRYDVIIATRWMLDEHIDAMRAENPDLVVYAYMNGTFAKPKDAASMPDSWFLKDRNGNRIKHNTFNNFYMDPGNAGWRGWVAKRCADWTNLSGFDGCYLDDMGQGNLQSKHLSSYPIDPRTGQPVELTKWVTSLVGLLKRVTDANPGLLVATSGLNYGSLYFEKGQSKRLHAGADLGHMEAFLRFSGDSATKFPKLSRWEGDVELLAYAAKNDLPIIVESKIWVSLTTKQRWQWRSFIYASFLLANDGTHTLYLNLGKGKPATPHKIESVDLGRPTEDYALRDGVYQRNFSKGRVLVNPTDKGRYVRLGGEYVRNNGRVTTGLYVAPHTGHVLTKN